MGALDSLVKTVVGQGGIAYLQGKIEEKKKKFGDTYCSPYEEKMLNLVVCIEANID